MTNKVYTAQVDYDPSTGDYVIPLPEDMCAEMGWNTGDKFKWDITDEGIKLTKVEPKKYFLVEAVSTFRMRYVVEQPNAEYASDTVVCQEAKEFSQEHIGEQIVSTREVTEDEIIELCDIDNHYVKSWTREQKLKTFVTEKDYNPNT